MVHTYCEPLERTGQWWDFFRKKLREGRQGYVVSPVVEQSEHHDLASVEACYEGLANGDLSDFRLALIHGRLPAREKDAVMQDFAEGKIQVLVATSVVEVGVDVPNATLMTIMSGQQFGLAQLHQLRGRVRRGKYPGYVCVFAEPANTEAEQRLEALVNMTDGFELAEVDFGLRGPGELFGFRQHGMPPLHIADLTRDMDLLIEARAVAQEMALAAPGRVRRLVILNIPVITNTRGNAAAQAQLRKAGGRSFWYQLFQAEPNLPEAMIPGNEKAWLGHFLKTWSREAFPEDAFEEYVRCYAIEHTPATGAAYYRCYKPDMARWAEIAGRRFAMPGLYIYGQHDPVIIEPYTHHLDDVFDDIRLEKLDAAHFVQEERPREVAALIAEFVDRQDE